MNKEDLIENVQRSLGEDCSKAHARRAVESVLDSIQSGLQRDREVQLIGFGSFSVKNRKARMGVDPRTRQPIQIAASRTVGFKPGKALKECVAQNGASQES